MATRGQYDPRNVPRSRAEGRMALGPLGRDLAACSPAPAPSPGAGCTPSSLHISLQSDRSDTMIVRTELPRLPGLGPDPPGCAPPAVMMPSPRQDSGPEGTCPVCHHWAPSSPGGSVVLPDVRGLRLGGGKEPHLRVGLGHGGKAVGGRFKVQPSACRAQRDPQNAAPPGLGKEALVSITYT